MGGIGMRALTAFGLGVVMGGIAAVAIAAAVVSFGPGRPPNAGAAEAGPVPDPAGSLSAWSVIERTDPISDAKAIILAAADPSNVTSSVSFVCNQTTPIRMRAYFSGFYKDFKWGYGTVDVTIRVGDQAPVLAPWTTDGSPAMQAGASPQLRVNELLAALASNEERLVLRVSEDRRNYDIVIPAGGFAAEYAAFLAKCQAIQPTGE